MKTINKIKTLIFAFVVGTAFFAAAIFTANYSAVKAADKNETAAVFEVKGASVRYVDGNFTPAVKFHIVMDKTSFGGLPADTVTGVAICPESLLGSEGFDATDANIVKKEAPKSGWFENSDGLMELIVFVYNIPADNYGTTLSVAGYYGGEQKVYTAQAKFSLAYVAKNANEIDEEKVRQLKVYYTFSAAFYAVDQTEIQSGEVVYGETLTAPEADACGWYNKSGTAKWDFGNAVSGNVKLYAKAHNYQTKTDADNHWQECSECGAIKDKVAHKAVWADIDGGRVAKCECGYEMAVEKVAEQNITLYTVEEFAGGVYAVEADYAPEVIEKGKAVEVTVNIEDTAVAVYENGKIKAVGAGKTTATVTYTLLGAKVKKSFSVKASSPDVIADYVDAEELVVLGLLKGNGISWVESFTDTANQTKNGLMKLSFSGNDQADIVTLKLSNELRERMLAAKFDFVELTICVDADSGSRNSFKDNIYSLYSWKKSIPDYSSADALDCRKWQTVKITLKDLCAAGSYVSGDDSLTINGAREKFCSFYGDDAEKFFHLSSWFAGRTVELYVDSVIWGVYPPDTAAPEISATGILKAEVNKEYTLPSFTATDDRDGTVAVDSVKLYDETETNEITVTDNKVTFTQTGKFVIVVTAKDSAGNIATAKFTVIVAEEINEKILASYDSADELGLLGLYSAGGSISWAESFADKDGVSKNGLMKLTFSGNTGAEVVTLKLSQNMIAKMKAANFDYIEMTFCVDNIDAYNGAYGGYSLYSANISIPDYSTNPLICKKWQTVRISLADLCKAGSYVSGSDSLTQDKAREKFLSYYGDNGALFFNLSSWFNGQPTVEMYVDSVSWGVNSAA